jgi:hypothetical protein
MGRDERNATRRFNRYVDRRVRLAREHDEQPGHPFAVVDCPRCEGFSQEECSWDLAAERRYN